MKIHNLTKQINLLFENRVDFILQKDGDKIMQALRQDHLAKGKYNSAKAAIEKLVEADPTSNNKYLQWIVNQYIKRSFRIEDLNRVHNALSEFEKKKRSLEIKDINQYKSLADLEDAVEDIDQSVSKRQQKQEIKKEGADVVAEGPDGVVIKLKTQEDACYYGAGTKWCTAAKNYNQFDEYNEEGPLYVFLGRDGRKFQFHFESGQFMDERDREADLKEALKKYPTLKRFFEIKVNEIDNPEDAYYFVDLFGIRTPKLESLIAKDSKWAFRYANYVIERRWPEAEPTIAKEPRWAYLYAKDVIKGPWAKAEPYIKQDRHWWERYEEFLKSKA